MWIVDLHSTLPDDKEMSVNGFRSAGITKAIENAKDMVEKVENPFKEVWLQNMFFLQTYEATTWLFFFFLVSFFNYPSLPNATQPDYGIINLIYVFLRFPLFGFYSGENIYSFLILVV